MKMNFIDRMVDILGQRRATEGDPSFSRVPARLRTLSGVVITPDTAICISAVWACLRYLSQTTAMLPWHVYMNSESGPVVQVRHPVDWLLWKRASDEWSSMQFRETMVHWALRYGNGYAEIEKTAAGTPAALWPIHPTRVVPYRDPDTQKLFYEVDGKLEFQPDEIFHLRGFGESAVGVNVIVYAAESLGWARAAQLFGAAFFGNGMNVSGVVKIKRSLSVPALEELKKQFADLYKGVRRGNKTAFLDNDMDWQAITIDPEKAQFIATNQHLVEEICRWFGVPPHKVMHLLRATFSNIEHQAIEVVVDSISPWAKRLEDEADFKLFGQNRSNLYSKVNLKGLLRGDAASRIAYFKGMREMGAMSANRILALEEEETIGPDGDKHVMQNQYTTLEMIGEATAAKPPQQSSETRPPSQNLKTIAMKRALIDMSRARIKEHV